MKGRAGSVVAPRARQPACTPARRRRHGLVAWFCSIALALLALGAPLHAIAHAQQVAQSAGSGAEPGAATQAHACELCLQFASLEGGAPAGARALLPLAAATALPGALHPPAARGVEFQAYASRAPPALG